MTDSQPEPVRPLDGVRVVEFAHFVAGPYATLQLAHYGADVIKVEAEARPDLWRLREGDGDVNASITFADHNKNKRSITLNTKDARSRAAVLELIAHTDVVVENFSFGVLERLGLGWDDLRAVRPDLIMLRLQGFGRNGPQRDWVAFGPSMMSACGMTDRWTDGDGAPVGSQTSYPDYIIALHAALLIVAALAERDETGHGREIVLSQFDASIALLSELASAAAAGVDVPRGNSRHAEFVPSGAFPCAGDDRWCYVEVRTEPQWRALAGVVPALAELCPSASILDRLGKRAEVHAALAEWTSRRSPDEVVEALQGAGVPAGMVMGGREHFADPHLAARGYAISTAHPVCGDVALPGPVGRHARYGPRFTRHAPLLGEHTEAVLTEVAGLSPDEVATLAR